MSDTTITFGDRSTALRLEYGDHVVASGYIYDHHGIYVGNSKFVHYSGDTKKVEKVDFKKFFEGYSSGYVKHHENRKHSKYETVSRAESRIGENGYHVFKNNCEHFCEWCINDKPCSDQVGDTCST